MAAAAGAVPERASAASKHAEDDNAAAPSLPAFVQPPGAFGVVVRRTAEEIVLRHADFPDLVRRRRLRGVTFEASG